MKPSLSKSQFIRGLQCHKALWLYKNRRDLRISPDEASLALFAMGDEVGVFARKLFPGGTEIVFKGRDFDGMVNETKRLIDIGTETVYEATFKYDNVLVIVDILHKRNKGWEIYEVKSSTYAKEVHLNDLVIQNYVLNGCGLKVSKASLVHINNDYVRDGDVDVRELFGVVDFTGEVMERQPSVESGLKLMRNAISRDCPKVDIGLHCHDPYDCEFYSHCTKHLPNPSVLNLSGRLKNKYAYYNNGIIGFSDLDVEGLNYKNKMEVEAELHDKDFIDKGAIKEFLDSLYYPQYFLDFETFMSAIPPFDGTSPYDQLPFQYSIHCLESKGALLKHYEFLSEAGIDQREELAKSLVSRIPDNACVLAYNKSFEQRVIRELAVKFPAYSERLLKINDNMVDLIDPFRKRHYYTREMRGSASLKVVLPALVPDVGYDGLTIDNGQSASAVYSTLHLLSDNKAVESHRKDLLIYCKLDTFAMVKLVEKLQLILSPII